MSPTRVRWWKVAKITEIDRKSRSVGRSVASVISPGVPTEFLAPCKVEMHIVDRYITIQNISTVDPKRPL